MFSEKFLLADIERQKIGIRKEAGIEDKDHADIFDEDAQAQGRRDEEQRLLAAQAGLLHLVAGSAVAIDTESQAPQEKDLT